MLVQGHADYRLWTNLCRDFATAKDKQAVFLTTDSVSQGATEID